MPGSALLDTSIIIALLGGDSAAGAAASKCEAVYVPSIALGELYYGAIRSSKATENLVRLDELAHELSILACDQETARHYGSIKADLKAKGRPIPENDIWIAAIAIQHSLLVATRDVHFREVGNLQVETWA